MNERWHAGNRIELLVNGEAFYPRVFEAIARARREVLLETFIIYEDKVGLALRKALLAARLLTVGHGASGLTGSSEPACHHGRPRPLSRKRRMRPCARSRLSGLAT